MRKEKSNLEKVRIELNKEVRALKNELKEVDSVYDGTVALEDEHEDIKSKLLVEKQKKLKIQSEKKRLQDEKKTLLSTMKEKYDNMTSKVEYDNVKSLDELKIKFTKWDLKLKANGGKRVTRKKSSIEKEDE